MEAGAEDDEDDEEELDDAPSLDDAGFSVLDLSPLDLSLEAVLLSPLLSDSIAFLREADG